MKEYNKKYSKKYRYSIKGKETYKRNTNKHYRNLGFYPLNKWFKDSEGHHINRIDVIYIPRLWHFRGHNAQKNKNMEPINTVAFFFLMMQNIDEFRLF